MIPGISNSDGVPVMALPLSTVMGLSMVKDAWENYQRYLADQKENTKETKVYNAATKKMEKRSWQSVRVGQIIKVDENEFFPADMVPFHSSDHKGTCYVETKGLDGETNLKLKQVE